MIFESPKTIIYIILVVLLSCVVSYAIRAYSTLFSPSLIDFIGALKIRMFNFEIFSRIYQYNDKLEKVFKDSNDDKVEADLDTFDINLWTLRFKSRAKQDEYIKGKFLSNVKMYRIIVIFDELRLIGLLADVFTNDRGDTVMVTVLVAFALSSFFLAFTFTRFFKRKIRFYINAFYVFSKCCTWILVISYRIHLSISLTLIPIYYILGFNID